MVGSASAAALLTGTAVVLVAFLALGLGRAGRRAGLARPGTLAVSVAVALVVWLGATATLAGSGVLADWSSFPPRWPLLALAALVTFALLTRTQTFRRLLVEIPAWQPVAIQTFRVGVELAFWRLHAEGFAPVQVTFEGRNLDALVGLTAPVVAIGLVTGWVGPRVTVAWNLFGLAMLLNAIGTVATSAPGPLHLDWPGEPFAAVAAWPVIWIPAFLAPAAIGFHFVSIRQAFGRLTASAAAKVGGSAG
jgi:hypothetical protein